MLNTRCGEIVLMSLITDNIQMNTLSLLSIFFNNVLLRRAVIKKNLAGVQKMYQVRELCIVKLYSYIVLKIGRRVFSESPWVLEIYFSHCECRVLSNFELNLFNIFLICFQRHAPCSQTIPNYFSCWAHTTTPTCFLVVN